MKIGIDIRPIGKKRTGDEVYFFNLVKNLAETNRRDLISTDDEYYLYTDRDPEKDSGLAGEIGKLGLGQNFKVVFVKKTNRFCWNFWALPNYLKKNPVDVFHTQYIAPFWLPKKIKLVLTIHDISFNFFPEHIRKSDLFFLKTLIPRSIRRADKIITVSQNEREQIIKFYKVPPEKVDVTYNGVDFERFGKVFSAEEKENVRKKYNLPEKFLLYVGTMQPRKNIPALLQALAVFYKKYNSRDMKLVIVGNKKARNFDRRIDEEIKNSSLSEQVIFPGWIEDKDLPAIYKLSECFVFPSLYEGFGIPIVEAMAAGIPVVSSDKSCLPEVGGDAALFADPANPADFAKKIHEVITDENLRSDLVKKGTKLAKSYTWQKTAEKTLEIYKSL
ncbi:MAG: glycosyltransferase family 1 protein [Patescibacteria group bacterium]|nr:glycosyltransferase family 1 protein [Patescibacteria group bacterium]